MHARAVAEQFVVQLVELRLIVGQAGIVGRLRPGHHRARLHQFVNRAQHRQRHVPAIGIEPQHAIAHAARRRDPPVRHAQLVNQRIGVDVIEAIARRHIRRLIRKDRGQVRILAVEINQVRAEVPLLQQEAAARQVVDPRPCLFRPGLVAVEPLAEGSQRQSRRLAHQRLVRRLVNHKAVDAVQQLLIGRRLQRRRRPRPRRCQHAVIDSAAARFCP